MDKELTPVGTGLPARRQNDLVGEIVGAFESETVAVFVNTAPRREVRSVWVLSALVVVTVALSCVVKLDIVVTGIGKISPIMGAIYLSPFDTAIVKSVEVKAGDLVKKGQPLALLDSTFTEADLLQLKEHKSSDEAVVNRERAEVADKVPVFSNADSYQILQAGIWRKRHEEYHSNLDSFDGQIRSTEALIEQYKSDMLQYTQRLKLAVQVEGFYKPLLDKGYVSALQLATAQDSRTEMQRLLADAQQQIDVNTQTKNSLTAQREAYIQKWHSDTGTQLVLDENDLDATNQLLEKAQKMRDLTALDSPEDAIVIKVGKASPGAVLSGAGQSLVAPTTDPLFTLMPVNAPLYCDLWIQSADIGFVKKHHEVRIKLDAYLYLDYGVARGVVESISENSFITDDNGTPVPPYFKVHVAITDVHLRYVPKNFRLLPGNTLTGDVMVGERTIMDYMLDGMFKTTAEAMREP